MLDRPINKPVKMCSTFLHNGRAAAAFINSFPCQSHPQSSCVHMFFLLSVHTCSISFTVMIKHLVPSLIHVRVHLHVYAYMYAFCKMTVTSDENGLLCNHVLISYVHFCCKLFFKNVNHVISVFYE